eukprot:Stramenopile-MAST_4_protein_2311
MASQQPLNVYFFKEPGDDDAWPVYLDENATSLQGPKVLVHFLGTSAGKRYDETALIHRRDLRPPEVVVDYLLRWWKKPPFKKTTGIVNGMFWTAVKETCLVLKNNSPAEFERIPDSILKHHKIEIERMHSNGVEYESTDSEPEILFSQNEDTFYGNSLNTGHSPVSRTMVVDENLNVGDVSSKEKGSEEGVEEWASERKGEPDKLKKSNKRERVDLLISNDSSNAVDVKRRKIVDLQRVKPNDPDSSHTSGQQKQMLSITETMCIYDGTCNPKNVYFLTGETAGKSITRRLEVPVYSRWKKFGFSLPGTPKKFSLGNFPTLICATRARDFSVYILDGIFNSINSQKQYYTSYFVEYLNHGHPKEFNLASFFGIAQDEAKRFCVKILKMSVYWTDLRAKSREAVYFEEKTGF